MIRPVVLWLLCCSLCYMVCISLVIGRSQVGVKLEHVIERMILDESDHGGNFSDLKGGVVPSRPSVIIIVPTRERTEQWDHFRKYMCDFWKSSNIGASVHVCRVEQTPELSFNRAWLFNVGVKVMTRESRDPDTCIVVHDVDLLPEPGVDYTACPMPTLLSSEAEHFQWGAAYDHYAGGVFSASLEHWTRVNGMSNAFWGWGGEDDELYERLKQKGLLISGEIPRRPPRGQGRFRKNRVGHNVRARIEPEYKKNVDLLYGMQSGMLDPDIDGLNQTSFALEGHIQTEESACGNPLITVHAVTARYT